MPLSRRQEGTEESVPLVAAMVSAGAPPAFSAQEIRLHIPEKGIRAPARLVEREQHALVLEQETLYV